MALGYVSPNGSSQVPQLGTPSGANLEAAKHPVNLQGVLDGLTFTGANVAATPVTTQAGLSATAPVLTLSNPAGSTVNLVLIRATVAFAAAPAALCNLFLAYDPNVPTSLMPANISNNLIGGSTAAKQGLCSAFATLGAAPKILEHIGGVAAAALTGQDGIQKDFGGMYVIAPGSNISIQTSSAASLLASFTWKEVAINAA
jgi:hypothetical protein